MTNNKNPNQTRPGEKVPRKFQYNPGNMAGKTSGTSKHAPGKSAADEVAGRDEQQRRHRNPVGKR